MELRKWYLAGGLALAVGGAAIMLKGAGPSTVPATQPVSIVPTTKPAIAPVVASADNSSSNRRDRSSRRSRGGRSESSVAPSGGDPFAVLQSRSIFVKGNQTIASDSRPSFNNQPTGPLGGKPESSLVFNGVIVVNDEADALVEDLSTHDVVKVRTGDAIAGGRVSGISFDDLSYTANGRTLHVTIGQNLEGVTAEVAPLAAPIAPAVPAGAAPAMGMAPAQIGSAPAGAAPAEPAPAGAAPTVTVPGSPGETSPDDIIARLKARRAAESGGSK